MSDAICKNCMYNVDGQCAVSTNIAYVREYMPSIQTVGQFRAFLQHALWPKIDNDDTCKFFKRRDKNDE